MAKKKIDPKAKAKRQKIYAAIGGVILLAVLAFQVPRTLKLLHQSNANASSATSSSSSTTTPTTTGPIVPPSLGGGASGGSGGGGNPQNQPPAKLTSASISVNGVSEAVQVGGQFPASNPTFLLVSVTHTSAKVGIAGGSIQGHRQTVTLKKNTPVTLMNTADGTRYVLRLLAVS